MSTKLVTQVLRVSGTFPEPLFYSEKWCDLSETSRYEKKVLHVTKVRDESIFQLWTIKLGECTLKFTNHIILERRFFVGNGKSRFSSSQLVFLKLLLGMSRNLYIFYIYNALRCFLCDSVPFHINANHFDLKFWNSEV